jgi:putative flippase GtrA
MNQLAIYVVCVVISSVANYIAQESFYWKWPYVEIAMLFGTGVALVVKYILVKKYAFAFKPRNRSHEAQVFFVYGLLGVLTTFLFWGIELGFHYYIPMTYSRQIGTVVGLLVCGYIKFIMDRDYVFNAKQNSP